MSTVGFAVELEAELVVPEGRSPDWICPIIYLPDRSRRAARGKVRCIHGNTFTVVGLVFSNVKNTVPSPKMKIRLKLTEFAEKGRRFLRDGLAGLCQFWCREQSWH